MGNLVTAMTELCKDSVRLGFGAASLGYRNPTGCLETSVSDCPVIRPHIPQERNPQLHRRQNLGTQNYLTLQISGEHGDNGW